MAASPRKNLLQSLFFATLSGAACVAFVWLSVQDTPGEGLIVDASKCELGKIREGQHEAAFTLFNEGRKPLDLVSIRRSCDCTSVAIRQKKLSPGESLNGKCTWDTVGFRGERETSFVIVYTIDGEDGLNYLPIELSAHVIPDITAAPERLTFELNGSAQSSIVAFNSTDGDPSQFMISRVTCESPALQADVVGGMQLRIDFAPEKVQGSRNEFSVEVVFRSEHTQRGVVVPVAFN